MHITATFERKKFLVICIVIILIGLCLGGVWFMTSSTDEVYYVYTDLSECEKLESYSTDTKVIRHKTTEADPYLGDLQYNAFYIGSYRSDLVEFEIFAYEFTTKEDAKRYFLQFGSSDVEMFLSMCPDANFWYSVSERLMHHKTQICVLDDTRAYYAVTHQAFREEEMREVLKSCFSKEIKPEETN